MPTDGFQIRYFIGGLSLFLYGIFLFQISIKKIGAKLFRRILQKRTATPFKAILSGTASSAILQSSSVVTLLILGFVGANILSFESAIGTIIGANIGSTVSTRMIAIFGFKLNLQAIALPLIGVAGILSLIFAKKRKLHYIATFTFGFGLLLFGIEFMKTSFGFLEAGFNIGNYIYLPLIGYLGLGLILTALLQSTAVNNIIVFAAVSTGVLSFEAAMAMIIGSNIGTTITALLGSLGGTSAQKRIAGVHIFYNISVGLIMFGLISPMKLLITNIGFKENVIGLAVYHTLFNILGAILFYPFIAQVAKLIKKIIPDKKSGFHLVIENIKDVNTQTALAGLYQDIETLNTRVLQFHLGAFNIKSQKILQKTPKVKEAFIDEVLRDEKASKEHYKQIESIQNKIGNFCIKIEINDQNEKNIQKFADFNKASINLFQAAKQIYDVKDKIDILAETDNKHLKKEFKRFQERLINIIINFHKASKMIGASKEESTQDPIQDITQKLYLTSKIIRQSKDDFDAGSSSQLFKKNILDVFKKHINENEVEALLTINLYLHNAEKLLLQGARERLLNTEQQKILINKMKKYT